MPHDISLISTIAVGLSFAFVGGIVAFRLRLPPLVGYLVAGIAVGPFTPGFVADVELSPQLAEIGVILLMFGVGMHFSIADLLAVRKIAVPGAIGQIIVSTLLGAGVATLWGWSFGAGMVFGLALSVDISSRFVTSARWPARRRNSSGGSSRRNLVGDSYRDRQVCSFCYGDPGFGSSIVPIIAETYRSHRFA